jgi:hypothetical protein
MLHALVGAEMRGGVPTYRLRVPALWKGHRDNNAGAVCVANVVVGRRGRRRVGSGRRSLQDTSCTNVGSSHARRGLELQVVAIVALHSTTVGNTVISVSAVMCVNNGLVASNALAGPVVAAASTVCTDATVIRAGNAPKSLLVKGDVVHASWGGCLGRSPGRSLGWGKGDGDSTRRGGSYLRFASNNSSWDRSCDCSCELVR